MIFKYRLHSNEKKDFYFLLIFKQFIILLLLILSFCKRESGGFSEPTFIYGSYPLNPSNEDVELYFSAVPYKNFLELANDYEPLIKYLNESTSVKIKYIPLDDYFKVYELLESKKIHIALIDPYYYLKYKKNGTVEFLLQPVYQNIRYNTSILTIRNDQYLNNINDIIKNQSQLSLVFDNPYSFFGYILPEQILKNFNLEQKNFKFINYSNNFENTAQGILSGNFDIGFIDKLTYEKYKTTAIGLKILYESNQFEHYTIVVDPSLDKKTKNKLIDAFLKININDESYKEILLSINPLLIGFKKIDENDLK